MMKSFVKRHAFYSCLVFVMFYGNCIGMNMRQKSDVEAFSDSTSIPISRSPIESEDFSDSSAVSDTASDSSSSSKKWISEHTELIQKACYEESSFDSLIDEIAKFSDSIEGRKKLYEEIENTWNEKNVFGATVLDDGTIIFCRIERFDF